MSKHFGRTFAAGRGHTPFVPVPESVFRRELAADHPLASTSAMFSAALMRQFNYGNPNYDFSVGTGGYAGVGMNNGVLNSTYTGFATNITWKAFSNPVYVIRAGSQHPRVPVWLTLFEGKHSGLRPTEENPPLETPYSEGLQALLQEIAVPDPDALLFYDEEEVWDSNAGKAVPALAGHKRLGANGTDCQAIIVDFERGLLVECFRLTQFREDQNWGPKKGDWKVSNAGIHDLSTYNGLGINAEGYVSASGCSQAALQISFQDVIDVLRGGKIKHALGCAIAVRRTDHIPPAIANDSAVNLFPTYKNEKGETLTNPAYGLGWPSTEREEEGSAGLKSGYVDAVPEGAMFRLKKSKQFSDYPGLAGGPMERAILEAMRDYGLFVRDGGGANCTMTVEDFHSLGSEYAYNVGINPLAGSSLPKVDELVNSTVPTTWTDTSLPKLTEVFAGTSSIVYKLFQAIGHDFEQIEPFSS